MSSTVYASNESPKSSSPTSSGHLLKYFKKKGSAKVSSSASSSSSSSSTNVSPPSKKSNDGAESSRVHDCSFSVAVSEDYNLKFRRTMEDAHVYIYNYADVTDSGYFAIFDGHAGADAAHWCSKHLHYILESSLRRVEAPDDSKPRSDSSSIANSSSINSSTSKSSDFRRKRLWSKSKTADAGSKSGDAKFESPGTAHIKDTRDVPPNQRVTFALNSAFLKADAKMAKEIPVSCGCTAAVALIRWESQSSQSSQATATSPAQSATVAAPTPNSADNKSSSGEVPIVDPAQESSGSRLEVPGVDTTGKRAGSPAVSVDSQTSLSQQAADGNRARMLYTANVGDARVVLCRDGKALRLSYDHKGSDANESARITNSGGIMYANRVNGMLAVTRSLGDGYMKSLVTGSPYTTRTTLGSTDEFLIIACDGIWDVCTDQAAVDLIRDITDPKQASQTLVKHAIDNFSSDNITCMVVRLDPSVC